jgi:tryptophanase
MSALKDFLVSVGGIIAMRDEANYQRASVQNFLDGSQPTSRAMEAMGVALQEIFASDSYVTSRVEQVNYLWRRLKDGIPILTPPGGHGVFIDVKAFCRTYRRELSPKAGGFFYYISGIRCQGRRYPKPNGSGC